MATDGRRQGLQRWLILALILMVIAAGVGGGIAGLRSTATPAAAASIIGWEPGVTRDVPLTAPLTVYFSRGMDHASVQRAWHLSPRVSGTYTWTAHSVSFRPQRPLRSGAYYRLRLGTAARDDQGKPLQNPLRVAFTTGDPLQVRSAAPANGTAEVPLAGLITVSFNHAMVALTGLGAPTPDPAGWSVAISPRTAGHGSWLGTSTWVFHPTADLVPSSRYIITLRGTVRDAWGEPLGHDFHWSFRTATPAVVSQSPSAGSSSASPAGDIRVTFNQPMDPASTAAAFSLHAAAPVAGTMTWQGNTLVFHPASALDPAQSYRATVRGSARSANGQASLGASVSWTFHVAPPPTVRSSQPAPNATAVYPYVELHFSAPMDQASLDRHLTVTPGLSSMTTFVSGPNGPGSTMYSINGDFQPSTAYSVTIAAGARDTFGRSLAHPYTLHFTTAPLPPTAYLYGPQGIGPGISFSAGRVVQAPVQFVNVSQAQFTLVHTTLKALNSGYGFGGPLTIPPGTSVHTWTVPVPHPLNHVENMNASLANADGSALAPGLYWIGVSGAGTGTAIPSSSEIVVAANASVTLKTGNGQALVWAVSARTGQPLAGVTLHLLDGNSKEIGSDTTDRQGTLLFPIPRGKSVQTALLDDGTNFGMATGGWQPAAPSTYSDISAAGQYVPPPNGSYVYTDRPIYRPGQTVHFRAIVWRDTDGLYSLYRGLTVTVQANDIRGGSLYRARLPLDRFGAIHGDFRLPASAATGGAYLNIYLPQTIKGGQAIASATFSIAEYRKPEFLSSVTAGRTSYVPGQTITATVHVHYVFGPPVAGQQVTWTAYSQQAYVSPPGWDAYQFGDQGALQQMDTQTPSFEGQFGRQIAQGTGTTNDAGNFVVSLPVNIARQLLDQTVTIEATATDITHQSVTGRVQVAVHPAAYAIGVRPSRQFVATGVPDEIGVVAVTPDGATARIPLTATIFRRTYTSELGSGSNGTLWRQVAHDALLSSQHLVTNNRGMASFAFTPSHGGDYYVVVEGRDQLGNHARGAIFIYASSAGFSDWGAASNTTISLQPDRPTYRVGQTAHILVAAPFANATALVTVERGSIRSYRVMALASNSPTLDFPITLADLPNVYVTITLYRGWRHGSPPDWRYGTTELHVQVGPRRLVVHLAQNKSHNHPGDPVTYTITTTDAQGHPVSAQVSLALVDTAVLALQDESNADILTALYGERPLAVTSVSDGVVSIDHLQHQPSSPLQPYGGQGGGGGGAGPMPVYHRFADTGYWSATTQTNNAGRASVRLTLPDNFTTWRLDARAVSESQQVGQAKLLTVSTQDVVLRPVVPRFLLQGDSLQIGAVVNNSLPRPAKLRVSLTASGLTLHSPSQVTISTPAKGERLLLWKAAVPIASRTRLTFRASPATPSVQGYAVQIRLPVHPPLTDETVATSGQVFGSIRQAVALPANALTQPGSLTIQVSAAVTSGMGRAWSTFHPTAYDSNEDIANRLLAAASLHALPASLTGISAAAHASLPAVITKATARLAGNQLSDGSWPWFNGSGSRGDIQITADVVQALSVAGSSGATLQRGRAYLQAALLKLSPAARAHLLFVLARSGGVDRAAVTALYGNTVARARLDPAALADLAGALSLTGDSPAAASLVSRLDAGAMVSDTGAHWEAPAGSTQSVVATTAEVLGALHALSPGDPLIPAAVRWLMLARQGNAWDSSPDSAQALLALTHYTRSAHEGQASYRYQVQVNGATKLTSKFVPKSSRSAATVDVPVSALGRGKAGSITIARQSVNGNLGRGPLYYVARLRYYLPATAIPARDEGLSVSRRYLDLAGHPLSSVSAGALVQVELTLHSAQTLKYLDLEDPIAAGFAPVDRSLNTSRQGLFPAWQPTLPGSPDLSPYLTHTDLRDDRVSLYVTALPPGTYRYTYLAQATVAGRYDVAPTHAAETFFPEVFGRSAGQSFAVR